MTIKALILVDLQNAFVNGGALAVAGGEDLAEVANDLILKFSNVVATRDWHGSGHKSFASSHPGKKPYDVIELGGQMQVLWPDHAVQGSHSAEFVANLDTVNIDKVIFKGTNLEVDSYSGFFDNDHKSATELDAYLKSIGAEEVFVLGLATDYCVKFTALDAVALGYKTSLIVDVCRAVNLSPGDGDKAVAEMAAAGVKLVSSEDILNGTIPIVE